MPVSHATTLDDLFAASFHPLTPAVTDVDRPRLMRRVKTIARGEGDTTDPFVCHMRREGFRESKLVPYTHRPFDTRWLYADAATDGDYLAHVTSSNEFVGLTAKGQPLVTRRAAVEDNAPAKLFPLYRVQRDWIPQQKRYETARSTNLSSDARDFARRSGIAESDLFHHAVAVLATEGSHPDSLPLPDHAMALRTSAMLGYRIATLLADDDPLATLTPQDQALRGFGVPTRTGKEARMLRGSALVVDSLWRNEEKVVTRAYTDAELIAVSESALDSGIPSADAIAMLGSETCDVYLNDRAFWRNVPLSVWRYSYDGVPLLRAWLRARHIESIDRALLREEVTMFSVAVRRIAALLLLAPALRRNAEQLA